MRAIWFLLAAALVMVLLFLPLRLIGSHTPPEQPRPGEYRLAEALRLAEREGKCVVLFIEPGSALIAPEGEEDAEDSRPRYSPAMLRARSMVFEDEIFADPSLRAWLDAHALFVRSGTLSRAEMMRFESLIGPDHTHGPHDLWVLGGQAPPRQAPALERRYLVEFFEAARTGEPAPDASESWRAGFVVWHRRLERIRAEIGHPMDEAGAQRYVEHRRALNHGDLAGAMRAEKVSVLRAELRDNPFIIDALERLRVELMVRYEAGSLADGLRWASVTAVELGRTEEAVRFAVAAADADDPDPRFMRELMELVGPGVIVAGRPDVFAKWWGFDDSKVRTELKEIVVWRRRYVEMVEHLQRMEEVDRLGGHCRGDYYRERLENDMATQLLRASERRLAGLHAGLLMIGEPDDAIAMLETLAQTPEAADALRLAIELAATHGVLREIHLPHLDASNPEHAAWIEKIQREP